MEAKIILAKDIQPIMKLFQKLVAVMLAAGTFAFGIISVHAADHTNLEEGLPTEVEDAYPIAYRGREFQLQGRYERTDTGQNLFVVDPRIEFGFARNWQAKIAVPFRLGSGDKTGSGDIGLEAFYNFNTESLKLPAFALSARADLPTGRNSSGVDTTIKFIATKTLGTGSMLQRLHLNLIYKRNAGPQAGERSNRYGAILGYSQRLGPDTIGVIDIIREQERMAGNTSTILELGLRRQVTPLRVIAVGIGAGLNQDAPDFRLTGAVQQSF